jgi:hypothetical protein
MTTTKKTTGAKKSTTTKRATRPATTPPAASAAATDEGTNVVLSTLRSGFGAMEFGTLAVADLPLSMLNKVGVPESATDAARSGSRSMIHGVNGTLDSLATQTFKFAGQGAAFVSGVVGSVKS